MKSIITALLASFMITTSIWAESDLNRRYNIQGYVLDNENNGISNQQIRLYKGRLLLEMVNTNSEGFYALKLKLRESDNQQTLKLSAGSNEAELTVAFDPDNLNTSQLHKAHFINGKFVEGNLPESGIPSWIYPLAGLIIISFLAVKLEKRRKRKIQQKKDKLSGRQSSNTHKTKKKRRRKH